MERVDQCETPMPPEEIDSIWKDACRHYATTVSQSPSYVPPEKYVSANVLPADCTDVGQARVFVAQYGDRIRYSAATKWLVYDGKKWNESELQAQKLAQELTDRQLQEAREKLQNARAVLASAQAEGTAEDATAAQKDVRKAFRYRAYVLAQRSSARIAAALTEARPAVEIDFKKTKVRSTRNCAANAS